MIKHLWLLAVVLLMSPANAEVPAPHKVLHADKDIYIDITEVYGPDGSKGTSYDLNILISQQATRTYSLQSRFHSFAAPGTWRHVIRTYDRHNIKYKPGYRRCNYDDALRCGVINKHWTILTHVTVGKRYTTMTMMMYNERAQLVSSAQKTTWGRVIWMPNWKYTQRTDSGNCTDALDDNGMPWTRCTSPRTNTVYEKYPPEMKELPPLLNPGHVHQCVAGLYLSLTKDFMRK